MKFHRLQKFHLREHIFRSQKLSSTQRDTVAGHSIMSTKSENRLFVTEDEDVALESSVPGGQMDAEGDIDLRGEEIDNNDDEDNDDTVIQEIPLNLAGQNEILHIFQYANKPKKIGRRAAEHPFITGARYKSTSSVWELDTPLDETAFYNKDKNEGEWKDANTQTLRGVGVGSEGQYAAFVADGQVYLTPVEKIAQLRPYFKYIDDFGQQRKQDDSKNTATPANQKAQVVTMSVRSVNDPVQSRLAGSLLAHKIEEEEEFVDLAWVEGAFEQFKESMVADSSNHELRPIGDEHDYLENLV